MSQTTKGIVLVTGAARRLGRAIALDFGKRGWSVAVHARQIDDGVRSLVGEIETAGGRAHPIAADLADSSQIEAIFAAVAAQLGSPTCLINNASLFEYDDIETLDAATWDRHFATNLRAPVFLAKALAAQLPQGMQGAVINILDQRVWKPTPHFLSYAASKSALWTMTQILAQALAPRVRVNAIGPGPMLQSVHQTEAAFAAQWQATLLQRPTSPDEVAAAIRYILDAPAMTGQMIALDGGQHLAWQTPDIGDGHG